MGIYSIILATGSYTSGNVIKTEDLVKNKIFYNKEGGVEELTENAFQAMGVIKSRMWKKEEELTSDLGAIALNKCFESSILKKEEIDYLIVAHNSGDNGDIIPPISYKVAEKSGFKKIRATDKITGCEGVNYALEEADAYIKSGKASKVAVVCAETLSRIRGLSTSGLLFADGAAAVIVGRFESDTPTGIIASHLDGDPKTWSALKMCNNNIDKTLEPRVLEMNGFQVYQKAVVALADTYFNLLKKANLKDSEVKFLLKHQASEKILLKSSYEELKSLGYDAGQIREYIDHYRKNKVPKSLHILGNSSVATTLTLLDIILKKKVDNPDLNSLLQDLEGYSISENDIFAIESVGAGLGWGGHLIKMNPVYWDYLRD